LFQKKEVDPSPESINKKHLHSRKAIDPEGLPKITAKNNLKCQVIGDRLLDISPEKDKKYSIKFTKADRIHKKNKKKDKSKTRHFL
jgi:hypothetical protein